MRSSIVHCPFSIAPTSGQTFSGYLFAYFEGGGDKNLQEQLRFAVSEDAKNWYALNGNPIIRDKHTADPAVLIEGDTLWLFAGHDMEGNQSGYVMKDWLLYIHLSIPYEQQIPYSNYFACMCRLDEGANH